MSSPLPVSLLLNSSYLFSFLRERSFVLFFRWVPFEVAKPLLDKKPYSVLSDFTKASETLEMNNSDEDTDSDSSRNGIDIANILISLNGARLRYKVIPLSLVHYSAAAPVSYQIIKF